MIYNKWKTCWQYLIKVHMQLHFDLAISFPGISWKIYLLKYKHTYLPSSSLFVTAKTWEST